jgi:DNA-binding transcriptional LysR family regulator
MRFDEQTLGDASVFVAVVRGKSFANAARSLNLSQSAASRAIMRLERRLGVRVFYRTTRSVSLTDGGRELFERLGPLMEGFEEAFASAGEGRSKVRGKLRVKVHPTLMQLITGGQIRAFLETYPELSLELLSDDRLGDPIGEGIDIILHVGELPPSRLVAKRLLDTRVITVAAPSYLERHEQITSPGDLLKGGHRFVDYRNPENGRPFQWEFHRGRKIVKLSTPGELVVSDIVTLHGVCMAGWGVAQVLEVAVRPLLASGALVRLLPEWEDERFPIQAVYSTRSYLAPKITAFLEFASSAVS